PCVSPPCLDGEQARRRAPPVLVLRCSRHSVALPAPDRGRDSVRGRGQGASPTVVVGAGRVVGEVEVEDEPAVLRPEVGPLHRVEEVTACAVRLRPAGRIREREEETAAVPLEPVQLELPEVEAGDGEPAEREAVDLDLRLLDRTHLGEETERRVVVEVRELGVPRGRRLRVVAKERSSHRPPLVPARARLRRAHLGIELEDPPLPVQQVQLAGHAATAGSVERRRGTSLRNQVRTNEIPETTAPTRNTGWSAVENAST